MSRSKRRTTNISSSPVNTVQITELDKENKVSFKDEIKTIFFRFIIKLIRIMLDNLIYLITLATAYVSTEFAYWLLKEDLEKYPELGFIIAFSKYFLIILGVILIISHNIVDGYIQLKTDGRTIEKIYKDKEKL